MTQRQERSVYYFPGCSQITTARESNQSMKEACARLGLKLIDLPDWNCCGSSSAHAVDPDLSLSLAARNLAMTDPTRPLMAMCPACFKNLKSAHLKLVADPDRRRAEERHWGGEISPELEIITFVDVLTLLGRLARTNLGREDALKNALKGLKVAPYYGCSAMFPPAMQDDPRLRRGLEDILTTVGAEVLPWSHRDRCCGTYLTVTHPDFTQPLVDQIMVSAKESGAECLVTACAMCQLNVELRCRVADPLPILHFSEAMALALGASDQRNWFSRHIVDPAPLLRERGLLAA